MPAPRPNSRRSRALDQLGYATDAIGKAISLLGGRTRVLSPKRDVETFVARKMIESCELRIKGAVGILTHQQPVPHLDPKWVDRVTRIEPIDEFEKTYDQTREPQC
jgi:hypothetical protein